MDAFLAPSAASPYQEQLKEYADSLLEQRFTKPDWCLLGLEAGKPVARAALWALQSQAIPTDIVLIEADWSDKDLSAGQALLTRVHEFAGGLGAQELTHPLCRQPARRAAVPGERRGPGFACSWNLATSCCGTDCGGGTSVRLRAGNLAGSRRSSFVRYRTWGKTPSSMRSRRRFRGRGTPGSPGASRSMGGTGRHGQTSSTTRGWSTCPSGGSWHTRTTARSPV